MRALCESYQAASGPPARERGIHTLNAEETEAASAVFAKLTDAIARVTSQSNDAADMRDLAAAIALLQDSDSHM